VKYYDNGLRYDTDTAELIYEFSNDLPYSDFNHCSWNLYITPKGAYFQIDNHDRLEVLTEEEAYVYLEDVQTPSEIIEKFFSHIIEDA